MKAKSYKRGQTAVEYLLLVAIVVGVVFLFSEQLSQPVARQLESVTQQAVDAGASGGKRNPASHFVNGCAANSGGGMGGC